LLHTKVTEVSVDEGPGSAPAIAAHVTDYARMLLYRFMCLVGRSRVLYVDTDSLIIRAEDLPQLSEVIDDKALGKLKVEGRATTLEIRGPKDYTFGESLRRKGIRANAIRVCRCCNTPTVEGAARCRGCGDHLGVTAFRQALFPGFYTLLRRGLLGGFPVGTITKSLTATYTKGVVSASGTVTPHVLSER
jgi:hypothetical protein